MSSRQILSAHYCRILEARLQCCQISAKADLLLFHFLRGQRSRWHKPKCRQVLPSWPLLLSICFACLHNGLHLAACGLFSLSRLELSLLRNCKGRPVAPYRISFAVVLRASRPSLVCTCCTHHNA